VKALLHFDPAATATDDAVFTLKMIDCNLLQQAALAAWLTSAVGCHLGVEIILDVNTARIGGAIAGAVINGLRRLPGLTKVRQVSVPAEAYGRAAAS
jgi:hypothetical protein